MIIANQYEVPDDCPPKCGFIDDMKRFGQGSICCSCPILNCKKTPAPPQYADKNGMFCLIEPEGYRPDWAKIWAEWFKGDMKSIPELLLKRNF